MPKKEITQQAYNKLVEQKEQIKQAMQEAWRRARKTPPSAAKFWDKRLAASLL